MSSQERCCRRCGRIYNKCPHFEVHYHFKTVNIGNIENYNSTRNYDLSHRHSVTGGPSSSTQTSTEDVPADPYMNYLADRGAALARSSSSARGRSSSRSRLPALPAPPSSSTRQSSRGRSSYRPEPTGQSYAELEPRGRSANHTDEIPSRHSCSASHHSHRSSSTVRPSQSYYGTPDLSGSASGSRRAILPPPPTSYRYGGSKQDSQSGRISEPRERSRSRTGTASINFRGSERASQTGRTSESRHSSRSRAPRSFNELDFGGGKGGSSRAPSTPDGDFRACSSSRHSRSLGSTIYPSDSVSSSGSRRESRQGSCYGSRR